MRWFRLFLLTSGMVFLLSSPAIAQECRRSCRVDETRDANGCCTARPAHNSNPGSGTARPLPRRCPAGSSWSDREHACIGTLVCPAGSHMEQGVGCVADAVGCPAGAHMDNGRCLRDASCPSGSHEVGGRCVRDSECPAGTRDVEGQCVTSNVQCPAGSKMENGQCIAEMSCPPGTHLDGGRCISADVQCPAGTHRDPSGCVGDPVCPAGTAYQQGRGCVGEACATGQHREGTACVADVACAEGTVAAAGRGCVSACESYTHAVWNGESKACVCAPGYAAENGECVEVRGCPAGSHKENGGCVGDVICPYGYEHVAGQGCVEPKRAPATTDPATPTTPTPPVDPEMNPEEQKKIRWANGPALQFWGQFGATYIEPIDPAKIVGAKDLSFGGALGFSHHALFIAIDYTRVGTIAPFDSNNPRTLDMLSAHFGIQGPGQVHTWRVSFNGGYEFDYSSATFGLSYRSVFRIVAGLMIGLELRGIGMYSPGANAWGVGGSGMISLGYSIH